MDPVSVASGVIGLIAVAFKTIELLGNYVKSAHEHKKTAEALHKELLLMKQVLDQLKALLEEERRQGRIVTADDGDRKTVLGKAFYDCTKIIEQIQEKLKDPVKTFQKAMAKLKWPFEQKEIARLVDSLRRYTQLFQLSLTAANCNLLSKTFDAAGEGLKAQQENCRHIQRLAADMPQMAQAAEDTLQQTEKLMQLIPSLEEVSLDVRELGMAQRAAERREQERRTTDILQWLYPLSALQKHSVVTARRADGTGDWFLKQDRLAAWISADTDDNEVLCLGDPGVGKTNLASRVIDHLRTLYKDADVAVVYYYCDYREQQIQSPANCAKQLLRQLSTQCNAMPTAVSEFYERTHNDIQDRSWYLELQHILCRVASTFSRCFIIMDALDEAEASSHRAGLLELLDRARGGITSRAPKVFATSRKHSSAIEDSFRNAIKVDVIANNADVRIVLAKIVDEHQDSKYILDEELKGEILDKLSASAHKMHVTRFLLPVLQVQYILSQLTKSEVRRSLQSDLSATLAEVFQSTIDRIKSLPSDQRHAMNRQSLAKNTLMWISYAKRVLTVGELQHALAVRLTDSDLDRDNFVDVRLIVDSCFGLVEIDRESSTIRFVHYSLQEFLKTHRHGLFENGDLDVTKVCLRYMSLDSVKSLHSKNRTQFTKDLADLAFLDYAAAKWGFHAANVAPSDVWVLAQQFLGSRPHLLAVARVRDQGSPYFRKWHERMHEWVDSGGADISLCANFGLTEFVRTLIGQNTQPMLKARNMYGSTALHEAAIQGFESTVEILLDRGADVLDVNTGKSTPLYLAVANNKIAMARLLLRQETDEQLAVAGKQGWTVLHKATDIGNEEMVTLLLQYGAQVNTEDERGMRPLHLAAREGHLDIVRLLLLSCAEVYCKDLDGLTPLDLAVTNGHVEVSKLLLENGAPVEHRGLDSWSALQRATRGGHEQVVALLLQCGANILTKDHKGQIPLHAAARSGNARVVALLLQTQPDLRKAQLWKRERKGSTPRDVAFFTAHFNIYKQLRAAELELQNYRTVTGASKMAFAIESGKREKVRRLIADRPNEIDAIIEGRQPALHLALQEQQHDIVRLLLDHGANINSVGYHGWTPLHITAAIGDLTLTNLCLSQGAHVAARTHTQQTVLHKACSSGNPKVAQVLLDAGADKEAENERGMRPLHVASRHNDLVTAQLLVMEYGVDVSAVTRFGETAAEWAERSGNLELLRFLRREEKKLRQADEGNSGF